MSYDFVARSNRLKNAQQVHSLAAAAFSFINLMNVVFSDLDLFGFSKFFQAWSHQAHEVVFSDFNLVGFSKFLHSDFLGLVSLSS